MSLRAISLICGLLIIATLFTGCESSVLKKNSYSPYEQEVVDWRTHHEKRMRSRDGYLAITAMFEMTEGEHLLGSSEECDFRIVSSPDNPIPDRIAKFLHLNNETLFQPIRGVDIINSQGQEAPDALVLNEYAHDEDTLLFHSASLSWIQIYRGVTPEIFPGARPSTVPIGLRDAYGKKIYLRVWDSRNPALENLKDPEYFPIDPAWRIEGEFRPFKKERPLYQKNVLGLIEETPSTGVIVFTKDDVEYTLETSDEDHNLFIVFGDTTNGTETYGGGRFMDVAKPTEGNKVIVDFNKVRNPWCMYSKFTTCAFPTKTNTLPIAIPVGMRGTEVAE